MKLTDIKFRAKYAGADEWAYGLPSCVYADNWIDSIIEENGDETYIKTDTLTIFTGYKDKNGNDIYDGDILRQWVTDDVEPEGGFWWITEVKQVKGCWVIMQVGFDYSYSSWPDEFTFLHEEGFACEVVGNIFDNQEMLKNNNQ